MVRFAGPICVRRHDGTCAMVGTVQSLEQFVDSFGPQSESFKFVPLITTLCHIISTQQVDIRLVQINSSILA
jgi:hypothetical protein